MKIKKIDVFFILVLICLTVFSVDLATNPSHRDAITNIWDSAPFQNIPIGLFISFIVCLIGNLSPIPTPYTWVVCGGFRHLQTNVLIPLLFAFIASLGALIGEIAGYLVGRGSLNVLSEERIKSLKGYETYIVDHPRLMPFLIFFAALTPLNDDIITVPAGLMKVGFKTTVVSCWLGKFFMLLLFAYNAFGFFDLCGFIGGENWIVSILGLYIFVVIVYLFVRIDFIKLIKTLREKASNIRKREVNNEI
ncbi:MAG: hypothetical protein GF383_01125 [Candidatus Lokiarchaeota archaeon]|nr:hypothetical protein [Candidatus Lokiarchaeota archaeon]MBD3337852.1 hypothetical protein [Candidatus Lokiarchaeota archaeon]